MDAKELQERSPEDLVSLASELKRELWRARFDNASGQLEDSSKIKKLRRDVARAYTVASQKSASIGQEGKS